MKKFLLMAASAVAVSALAGGLGSPVTVFNTANITGLRLTNGAPSITNTVDVSAGKEVTLEMDFKMFSGATSAESNSFVTVYRSVTGTAYEFTPLCNITVPSYGITNMCVVTNLSIGGAQWLQTVVSTASPTIPLTNSTIKVSVK